MLVAGDERGAFILRQGYEVVVAGVGGSDRRRVAWVLSSYCGALKPLEDTPGLLHFDPLAQLWVCEGTLELSEKGARHYELELALLPGPQQPRRGTSRREQRGDDDV